MTASDRAAGLARAAGRRLRVGYAVGLCLIAALVLGSHALLATMLSAHGHDAATINLAGRQRMLSQRVVKEALLGAAWPSRPGVLERLDADLLRLDAVHARLAGSGAEAADASAGVLDLPASELDAALAAFQEAAGRVREELARGGPAGSLGALLRTEKSFLLRMDERVAEFEAAAALKVARLRRAHLAAGLLLLGVIGLEALLLFRPAVHRIRRQMFDLAISQERTQLLATVAEHTRHAVLLAEADGTVSWVNPAAEAAFHGCAADVPRLADVAPAGVASDLRAAIAGGEDLHLDDVPHGGSSFAVDLVAVRDDAGRPRRYVLVITDLSERAQRERDEQDVQRRAGRADVAVTILHNVGNTLNSLALAASSADTGVRSSRLPGLGRALGLLGADAATAAAFLRDDPRGGGLPRYLAALHNRLEAERSGLRGDLETVLAGVEHLRHVVARENDVAHATAEAREAVLQPVDAEEIVQDALRIYGGSATIEGIALRATGSGAGVVLHADRHAVLQILGNLITNAVRATREAAGGEAEPAAVQVRVVEAGVGFAAIEVVDRGVGIEGGRFPTLFRPGNSTKPGGLGIGLHTSANAATAMGGRLDAASEGLGRGATLRLELPLAPTPTASAPRFKREAA
ncbi:ATP-binding protein [Phycisphaera mikurensis]|uniref:histidine kinase n=1 Tax=Phycisphaera mikurensis (strain NBRC 102666 / KCTC 22515 / FYK2301M01) TaxID=1142394 RepID=I0IEX5_PHYMF|nr:ATP-binding protein [Phycisphaera mikurensis]MBB6441608.1 signal transduction histidine kinase [Phycisphaera mikurensis]BAM03813.1 putative two-component system sensor histidine kinase [Phycisphaera mikurensis NBRC 102666]